LRVHEYGEFERLGSERMLTSNARIISATNCSLRESVRQGKFREDLFHRLNGLTLLIPALRERMEELPALIAAELKACAADAGKKITAIHPEAMQKLLIHSWPGNLRELNHTVRTMILFCDESVVRPEHVVFPPDLATQEPDVAAQKRVPDARQNSQAPHGHAGPDLSLAGAVERHVRFVYRQTNENQRRAAKLLGISRATLARHLRAMNRG
jgi:DNA-binding NtrC family response regulator